MLFRAKPEPEPEPEPELVIDGQRAEGYEIPYDVQRGFQAEKEEDRRRALYTEQSATAHTRSLKRVAELFRQEHGRGYNLTVFGRFVVVVRFYDKPDEWGNKWRLRIELGWFQ